MSYTVPPTSAPVRGAMPMWPVYLCVMITALGIGIVTPLIPDILQSHGADEFIVGLTTSVMFATLALTALPIGKQIDRHGVRPFLLLGLVAYIISMVGMPFTSSIPLFFVLRAFEGLGWSAVWTAAETYVSQGSPPERRGRNMAMYGMSLSMGTASGPLIGTLLWSFGKTVPFFVAVAAAIVAGAVVLTVVPKSLPPHAEHHDVHVEFKVTKPLLLPLMIAFLYGYGTLSLMALVPTLNFEPFRIGMLITVTIVANIAAQIPIGRMIDRFGYRPILRSSLTLLCLAAVLATIHPPFPLLLLLGALLGAFAGTLYPIGLAILAGRVPPTQLGGANGMFTVCYGIGSVIGPALTGLIMARVGSAHSDQALFGTIGALVFLMLVSLMAGIDFAPKEPIAKPVTGSLKPPL